MNIPEKAEILKPEAGSMGDLIVSVVRYEAPVGKPYGYKEDKLINGKNYRSAKATAETLRFKTFEEFVAWRKLLTPEYMLTSGTFENVVSGVPVVFKGKERPGEVSVSKSYLSHRIRPGVLIVDIDVKDPEKVAGLYFAGKQPHRTYDAALEALSKVLPEADECALMIGWSTSSNLFKGEEQVKGTGGIRIYIPVTDASQIPHLLEIMNKRSWLCREGWAFVDGAGKFQERSFVDVALGRPTQPDYAAPDLKDGLRQNREWEVCDGEYLDPYTVAPLTAEEEERYETAVGQAEAVLAPEMDGQRRKWLEKKTEEFVGNGLKQKSAKAAAVQLLDNRVLFPTGSVIFDDGTEVSVRELLTNGASYSGKTLCDPVEPNYNDGASVAIFYWNDGFRPGFHSFAHGSRWYDIKFDAESLLNIASGDDPDMAGIISVAALTVYETVSERIATLKKLAVKVGLGNAYKSLEKDIEKKKAENAGSDNSSRVSGARENKITEGRWPHDKPLPNSVWPMTNAQGAPLAHLQNIEALLNAYGIGLSYNVILKDWDWVFQGVNRGTDNADGSFVMKVRDLIRLNGLNINAADAMRYLMAIADARQVNPVTDYLSELNWDGVDRIPDLADALEPDDKEIAEISLYCALMQACAAADGAEIGRVVNPRAKPVFEIVLTFLGGQGAGKTKGLAHLVPAALARYVKTSVVLDIANKDSVKAAVSGWICELGELDATYSKAAQTAFKAFMSRDKDELRLPYAATHSRYRRRTVFIGTVNEPDFLRDQTGSRRFLPLAVGAGFPRWLADEVDQLWAQVWAAYVSGEQWWPTDEEETVLAENAEAFRQRSGVEEALFNKYDWVCRQPADGERRLASQIATETREGRTDVMGMREVGYALSNLWRRHGAVMREGHLKIETKHGWVKVNSSSGKNLGWLLPPRRVLNMPKASVK